MFSLFAYVQRCMDFILRCRTSVYSGCSPVSCKEPFYMFQYGVMPHCISHPVDILKMTVMLEQAGTLEQSVSWHSQLYVSTLARSVLACQEDSCLLDTVTRDYTAVKLVAL